MLNFHLFKEVYLIYEKNVIDGGTYRVVVSKENGYPDNVPFTRLLASATSFDELVGEGKQFSTFVDLVNSLSNKYDEVKERINIYVDKEAFVKFSVAWTKTLFESPTADSAYNFVKSYVARANRGFIDPRDVAKQKLITLTRDEFTTEFNSFNGDLSGATAFVADNTDFLSIEVVLGTYLANGSLKETFVKKLLKHQRDQFVSFARDYRKDLVSAVLRKDFIDGAGLKTYTLDNIEDVVSDPALATFWKIFEISQNDVDGINQWAELPSDQDIENFKQYFVDQIWKVFQQEPSSCVRRFKLLKHLRTFPTLSDESLLDIMNFEIFEDMSSSFSSPLIGEGSFNTIYVDILLEPIRDAKAQNIPEDRSYLQPYIIRTAQ